MKTLVLLCQVAVPSHGRKYKKSCAIVPSCPMRENVKTLVLLYQVAVPSHERKYGKCCAIVPSTTLLLLCQEAVPCHERKYEISCAIAPSGRPVITEKILCYCAKWPSESKCKKSTVNFNSPPQKK